MEMLLCQITTIAFVVYATLNTVAYYRLRKEVNGKEEKKKSE